MRKLLSAIEKYGNKIPHPSLMFFWLCVFICVLSFICSLLDFSAIHPITQALIDSNNLLDGNGIRFIFTSMVKNFIGFAPVGVVLVAMLGLGIADKSGLMDHLLLKLVNLSKGKWLTFFVAFSGIMSSMAADSGYVILIPLSALMFRTAGRPAIAGIATAFAGVSAGYGANLFIGPFDAILASISTEAAQIIEKDALVPVTCNWLILIASTFLLATLITVITECRDWRLLAPTNDATESNSPEINREKKSGKGLLLFTTVYLVALFLLVLPENAPLRNPETGSIINSPFIQSIVIIIALYFAGLGMVFGFVNKTFKQSSDVILAMEKTMHSMAGYLVLMFFAAQFVAYFNWSNLGLILSIKGAEALSALALPKYLLLIVFILITAFINLFIGSGSAKWALLASIFIPMLMLLGIPPETTQMAYRIGDSSTNIISPMMPYFALALSFLQQHQEKAGIGTLMAAMLPYSMMIMVVWTAVFLLWLVAGLPLGI